MIRDSALQTELITLLGEGLPLVSRPYADLAVRLGCSEARVIEGIQRLQMRGDLKRFGVVVRHRRLGYRANGMVVWNIPDDAVADLGRRIGSYDFVTLCYRRPRRPPAWPYNLFSMIHGKDRETVIAQVERMAAECGLEGIDYRILFSRRCFRQRGARYRPGIRGLAANG